MDHPLTSYRQRRGLSLDALAVRAETTKANLWRIENRQHAPSLALLRRLVKATAGEVTAAELAAAHSTDEPAPGAAA